MGHHARQPTTDEQIRHLQELVRRLGTRKTVDTSVEDYQDLTPYLGVGWSETFDQPRFYRDRDRVYFAGVITFDASVSGAQHRYPVASMPTGYKPLQIPGIGTDPHLVVHASFEYTSFTAAAARHQYWELGVDFTGQFYLEYNPEFAASPDLGYAPDGTAFMLDGLSYRATA